MSAAAEHLNRIQEIIARSRDVMVETNEFEKLALEVLDRSLSQADATETAERMKDELLERLEAVASDFEALPATPDAIQSGWLLRSIEATSETARENLRITEESILVGRSMVESAINGSRDAVRESGIRALKAGLSSIFADMASIMSSISNQTSSTPVYQLGRAQLVNIEMMRSIVELQIEMLSRRDDENIAHTGRILLENLEEKVAIIEMRTDRGRTAVSDNEKAIAVASLEQGGGNLEVLSRALETFDRSYRIEEELAEIIYEYAQYVVDSGFSMEDSEEANGFSTRMSVLEDQRSQLARSRREILSELN